MFENFKKRKSTTQEFADLVNLQNTVIDQMKELKKIEKTIDDKIHEADKTIKLAKEYLALCGYTEKDIERMIVKNRMKVIKK